MNNDKINEYIYIKYAIILIGIVGLILFVRMGERKDKLADKRFHDLKINGVIEQIKFFENQRGTPSFYIAGTWHNFGLFGHMITPFAKLNDSIAKNYQSDTINIFRKNEASNWIYFKSVVTVDKDYK